MTSSSHPGRVAFVGGGNMASAIIGGLRQRGMAAEHITVIEPYAPQREKLFSDFGIQPVEAPSQALHEAQQVVWAVKPQLFREAAAQVAPLTRAALHLSVMAGIQSESLVSALDSERIVRAMPNTPALIGQGVAGLFARDTVSPDERLIAQRLLSSTCECVWVQSEQLLDAVTALSGSGPAYVFYFIESMIRAGVQLGLTAEQARQLAQSTFVGAAQLAQQSPESPEVLRQRVTSKGGTTYAALSHMQAQHLDSHFEQAILAAAQRAAELGREFG